MSKKDPKIIRVGDMVKIINPKFFVRCGYPMDFKEAFGFVDRNYNAPIHKLIKEIEPVAGPLHGKTFDAYEKIVRVFAYEYMKMNRFGGPERRIYTREIRKQLSETCRVLDIRFVKTGTYVRGAYEEPPYLSNEQAHKILMLDCFAIAEGVIEPFDEIEVKNVVKIGEGESG